MIQPPPPSRRPPRLEVAFTATASSNSTIRATPASLNVNAGVEDGMESYSNANPNVPSVTGSRKGKVKVIRLAEKQSSKPATLEKNASTATAALETTSSPKTQIHSALNAIQQIPLGNALGLRNSPLPDKCDTSPQPDSQNFADGKQGGSTPRRKRRRRDKLMGPPGDHSIVPNARTGMIMSVLHLSWLMDSPGKFLARIPNLDPLHKSNRKQRGSQATHHRCE